MILKVLLLLFCITAFSVTAKPVIIKGKIIGKLPETLYYTAPVNGSSGFDFSHKAKMDTNGNFEIKVDVDAVTFIDIYYKYQPAGSIVATPGNTYGITITETDGKINSVFTAKDLEAQNAYNTMLGGNRMSSALGFAEEIRNLGTTNAIQKLIDEKEKGDVARFQSLYNAKVISSNFLEAIKTERKYFYAVALGYGIMNIGYFDEKTNTVISPAPEFFKLWGTMLDKYGTNFNELHKNPYGYRYLEIYKVYRLYEDANFKSIVNNNMLDLFTTKRAWFTDSNLEYYVAAYLSFDLMEGMKEEVLLDIYEAFKKEFPKSSYIKYLEPLIAPLAEFRKQKTSLPANASFVDDYANINSVDELIKKFPGKKLYIDVWATWCGPCREEFKYKAELYKLLKANDITVVYISIDTDEKDEAWKKMINFYGLESYHIRTNKTFSNQLYYFFNVSGTIAIPWYILVGADGVIASKYAVPPSEMDKLEKEITKL